MSSSESVIKGILEVRDGDDSPSEERRNRVYIYCTISEYEQYLSKFSVRKEEVARRLYCMVKIKLFVS